MRDERIINTGQATVHPGLKSKNYSFYPLNAQSVAQQPGWMTMSNIGVSKLKGSVII